ncbi:hypothetical protein ACFSR7_35735, partial [Cohnella sp. GCM10020058]
GKQRAYEAVPAYDPLSAYSVTYIALDTYAQGIAPQSISADYASNQKEALDDVNRGVTDLRTAVSVLQVQKAGKQQAQWIAATPINGWTNRTVAGVTLPTAAYTVDDSGRVSVRADLTGGTTTNGTVLFKIPQALAPKRAVPFTAKSVNVSTWTAAGGYINTDGSVILENGAGSLFAFYIIFSIDQ